ncbi:MAG: hypothetical protein LC114_11205 [Bryobacterales bacterium]|nr:hypothetical protein [Bryobacterales bacterium]
MACSLLVAVAARAEEVVRGSLVAYRPAEVVRQVASHVLNREVFLFSPLDRRDGPTKIFKVMHEHYGQSNAPDPAASEGVVYELRLQRKKACDESFESYVKNSPALVASGGGIEKGSAGSTGVLFLNGFDSSTTAPQTRLACYVLRQDPVIVRRSK